jgi:hypothetical protein|tara:strand:+ start:745 stop:927 length:183 start_codon:yes stop_codon:yes gene_type:complete
MAFKMTSSPFKTGGKRKRARASAKAQVEGASKLGMSLDERKLFKQELAIQRNLNKRIKNN